MARVLAASLGATIACVFLLASGASMARADGPDCPSSVMYVAAHADDTLLFQSPTLLEDVRSGRCVWTVFLTAGDAGKGVSYWGERETGVEAGYAQMLGVPNEWTESELSFGGHSIEDRTLDARPKVSISYMRLPDGGPSGTGTAMYGNESLTKLWRSVKGGSPSIGDIEAVDGSTDYDFDELVDVLAAMMDAFGPRQIATQDYVGELVGPDHADHVATGKFVEEAAEQYEESHRLRGFLGYDSASEPQNVFGDLLSAKSLAFYRYGEHDSEACESPAECATKPAYEKWLAREYVADEDTVGAVAQAGYPQAVSAGDPVDLDGSESSGESGDPLAYAWTQVGGIGVTLSGSATATPSFVAPPFRTSLVFALTVAGGATLSESDFVTVEVDGPEPPPPDSGGATKSTSPPPPSVPSLRASLSTGKVRLVAGRPSRRVVEVYAPSGASVKCSGALPKGARCRVNAQHNVVVEGSGAVKRTGTFRLTVQITDQTGTVRKPLVVRVRLAGPRS